MSASGQEAIEVVRNEFRTGAVVVHKQNQKVYALLKSLFRDKFSQQFVRAYISNKLGVSVTQATLSEFDQRYRPKWRGKKS